MLRMPLRRKRWIMCFSVFTLCFVNIWLVYHHIVRSEANYFKCSANEDHDVSKKDSITILLREFEQFENDIARTINETMRVFKDLHWLIVSDENVYPPISISPSPNIQFFTLHDLTFRNGFKETQLDFYLSTDYVLILPDVVSFIPGTSLSELIEFLPRDSSHVKMVAFPIDNSPSVECLSLQFHIKQWTLEYKSLPSETICDAVKGKFALLIGREDLLLLPNPLLRPVFVNIFAQSVLRKWKVLKVNGIYFRTSRKLFSQIHNRLKQSELDRERQENAFKTLGIKVIRSEHGRESWFGCSKDSERCFGTVLENMPQYMYVGRWTPPCCLKALRLTARHVLSTLESQGVRYWLEGGSLLGAARHEDIIPWDYDVDIGIYRDDIVKCSQLTKASASAFEDNDGFVWEQASEGDFYRVQYSRTNHLHVDIFPFFSLNGTMTKRTWFESHRQDREFPEHYLKPLTMIPFMGMQASAPSNVRHFLEYKFGKGVIENPRYPDNKKPT